MWTAPAQGGSFVPRASDSPDYRASDYQAPGTWASDPAGPDAWASDPDGRLAERAPGATESATDPQHYPATDPASEWDGRAWGATDPIRSLTHTICLGAALEAFCSGKAAEGLSPRSIVWYRMIGQRLVGRFGAERRQRCSRSRDRRLHARRPRRRRRIRAGHRRP